MISHKIALGSLGLVALAGAAGAGAYVASRSDPAPSTQAPVTVAAGEAVQATEAVLDEPVGEASAAAESKPETVKTPAAARPAPPRRPRPARAARREAPRAQPASTSGPRPADRPRAAESRTSVETTTPRAEAPAPLPGERPTDVFARSAPPEMSGPAVPALPPEPEFEELTVPANAVIGLQLEDTVSTERAQIEDRVEARVTRDVRAQGRVVVPAGSRVLGSVNEVERGGKLKERARLGVRFHTIILADGSELPLQTETVYREGEPPSNASAAKIGAGAIGGAILGAILGGGKGAAIGGAVGAGAGTTAVMAGGRRPAELEAGSTITVKLLSPLTVTLER